MIIEKIFLYLSPTPPNALYAPNYFFFLFSIMICRHVLTRNHCCCCVPILLTTLPPNLSGRIHSRASDHKKKSPLVIYVYTRYATKQKRFTDPKRLSLWRNKLNYIQIYIGLEPKKNVLLMLIDNQFAQNECETKYCYGSYINTPNKICLDTRKDQVHCKTHFLLVTFCDINIVNRVRECFKKKLKLTSPKQFIQV